MNKVLALLGKVSGYKTYIVAVAAVIYGLYTQDADAVLLGLGLAGLRNGVTAEITNVLVRKKR